jgi:chemotaxis protein MotB
MAFFLVMWLLNMSSPEKRIRLATYFKNFSIFEETGTSFLDKREAIFSEPGESVSKAMTEYYGDEVLESNVDTTITMGRFKQEDRKQDIKDWGDVKFGSLRSADGRLELEKIEVQEDIMKALSEGMQEGLSDIKDQVMVDVIDSGVRIQMIDKEGGLMFEIGNPTLTQTAKEVLRIITKYINTLPNKVVIEGHTDALPYAGSGYSNWELSTERASSARKVLETNGLDLDRIARVAGYAATNPFIVDNKDDPRNRRVSIILLFPPKRPDEW